MNDQTAKMYSHFNCAFKLVQHPSPTFIRPRKPHENPKFFFVSASVPSINTSLPLTLIFTQHSLFSLPNHRSMWRSSGRGLYLDHIFTTNVQTKTAEHHLSSSGLDITGFRPHTPPHVPIHANTQAR